MPNSRTSGSKALKLGLDWYPSSRNASLSLTAFDNRVEERHRQRYACSPICGSARTCLRSKRKGIEGDRRRWSLGALNFDASLAYTDATIDRRGQPRIALDGNRPPQTPDFSASATLAWESGAVAYAAIAVRCAM